MLKDRIIIEELNTSLSRISHDRTLNDICYGQLFKNNVLFSHDPYYDELELCNPLGSYVKKNTKLVWYSLCSVIFILSISHHCVLLT